MGQEQVLVERGPGRGLVAVLAELVSVQGWGLALGPAAAVVLALVLVLGPEQEQKW